VGTHSNSLRFLSASARFLRSARRLCTSACLRASSATWKELSSSSAFRRRSMRRWLLSFTRSRRAASSSSVSFGWKMEGQVCYLMGSLWGRGEQKQDWVSLGNKCLLDTARECSVYVLFVFIFPGISNRDGLEECEWVKVRGIYLLRSFSPSSSSSTFR